MPRSDIFIFGYMLDPRIREDDVQGRVREDDGLFRTTLVDSEANIVSLSGNGYDVGE